ncbi:MAG: FkbM family methyltransferase, partial [Rhodobacterales bacterium]|nr:FkbM family methyltransferase [Rhodobacterales bacterium]
MFQGLADFFAQYRAMLSKAEKRRREAGSNAILAALLPRLGPDDTVIDCGANVGLVTGALAATGARVIAFEPDPVAFDALSQAQGTAPNVSLHNAAVGVRNGEISLMRDRSFHKDPLTRTVRSTTVPGGRRIAGATLSVPLIDLPAFLANHIAAHGDITFLKLDIEGAEIDILEALEQQSLFDHITLTVAETHEKK